MHLRATLGIFRGHLWAFLAVAALVPACAWIAIERTTPRYTASGSLIYEPSDYNVRELESILRTDPTTEAVMASQAEVLQSLKIAQRVAQQGNLFASPEFNPTLRPRSASRIAADRVWSVFGRSGERDPPKAIYGPVPDPGRDANDHSRCVTRCMPNHIAFVSRVGGDVYRRRPSCRRRRGQQRDGYLPVKTNSPPKRRRSGGQRRELDPARRLRCAAKCERKKTVLRPHRAEHMAFQLRG